MSDKNNQPVTSLEQFRKQRTDDLITGIYQALVVNTEVKTIPESTFVKEILPILTGQAISADFPLLIAGVAGSPFSEVDVINDAGEIIFRMPSLLERNIINHDEASKRGSMESMFITVEQLSRNSPQRAEKYMEHELQGRGIASNRDEIIKQRQDRWNVILARYGLILKEDGVVIESNNNNNPNKPASSKDRPSLDFGDDGLL